MSLPSVSAFCMVRPVRSQPPPGAAGTISCTVLLGYSTCPLPARPPAVSFSHPATAPDTNTADVATASTRLTAHPLRYEPVSPMLPARCDAGHPYERDGPFGLFGTDFPRTRTAESRCRSTRRH